MLSLHINLLLVPFFLFIFVLLTLGLFNYLDLQLNLSKWGVREKKGS